MKRHLKLSLLLLALCLSGITMAQRAPIIPSEKPRLIVGVVVDHMRADFIFRYWNQLGEGGFKRLMNQGTFCKNARYNYLYSQSGIDHASIFTGTAPSYHGIISHGWFNRLSQQTEAATFDEDVRTVGGESGKEKVSARKMLAPTLGDEMKLFNAQTKVIGIGLNREASVFSAGHAADAAYWLEEQSGRFVTSSYYQDTLFNWVNEFNEKKFADFYLDRAWTPYDGEDSNSISEKIIGKAGLSSDFFYDLNKEKKHLGYKAIKATPFGNMLVKDFAIATIVNENLGKDDDTDLLSITFSCLDFKHRDYSPFAPEMVDNFIRLDREIEHFLSFLDDQIGKQNTLVFLTADQTSVYSPEVLAKQNIPNGYFSSYNAIALLKSYFNVIYGSGDWVSSYDSQQLYLNHRLIEDSKLSLEKMQDRAARFLIQFSGVANTISAHNLVDANFSHGVLQKIQRSYNQKRSGDVLITLEPGWMHTVKDERDLVAQYSYNNQVPLFWYGWKINRSTISRPLKIEDIVPTITSFLNISTPNGCEGNPIEELVR
ncbi:MAG: alkaline phosphatase family protein [Marinifilaceae bacterium]